MQPQRFETLFCRVDNDAAPSSRLVRLDADFSERTLARLTNKMHFPVDSSVCRVNITFRKSCKTYFSTRNLLHLDIYRSHNYS